MIFIADIQLHAHQNRSHTLPNGRNSRLQDGLNCLGQAFYHAAKAQETLIINGDLFHDRKSITIDVLHATMEVFYNYTDVKVIINIGNHDQYLRDGSMHSTSIFSAMPNVTVVDKPRMMVVEDLTLFIHPFTEKEDEFKKQVADWTKTLPASPPQNNTRIIPILVAHQGVSGSLLAGNTKAKGHIAPADLHPKYFDHVFLGHYHRPQTIGKNIYYIGSPYEIDEGEAGDEKRFMRLTRHKDETRLSDIPVTGMPKFRKVSVAEVGTTNKEDFVTVICNSEEEVEQIRDRGYNIILNETGGEITSESLSDITPLESVKKALQQLGREDLLAKAKTRSRL